MDEGRNANRKEGGNVQVVVDGCHVKNKGLDITRGGGIQLETKP